MSAPEGVVEPRFEVNSELSYQKKSCSECQKAIFQYVNMSVCQYVSKQLFSLKMKLFKISNCSKWHKDVRTSIFVHSAVSISVKNDTIEGHSD